MNVHDLAAARALRPALPTREGQQGAAASGGAFGKVYDLETARRGRDEQIPSEVRDEIQAADRLYHELAAQGREVRFHEGINGGVVARLCDLDGNVVRPIGLNEAINMYKNSAPGPDPAA